MNNVMAPVVNGLLQQLSYTGSSTYNSQQISLKLTQMGMTICYASGIFTPNMSVFYGLDLTEINPLPHTAAF